MARRGSNGDCTIAGKLYHTVGPLQAPDDRAPGFAQLYVHDPAAENDEAVRRYAHMYMDDKASAPEKTRALKLLTELQSAMRECNTYVQDFVTAGEIFAEGDVDDAHFVIEPKARPATAHKRTYKDAKKAFDVSVSRACDELSQCSVLRMGVPFLQCRSKHPKVKTPPARAARAGERPASQPASLLHTSIHSYLVRKVPKRGGAAPPRVHGIGGSRCGPRALAAWLSDWHG